jgi:hypothetical protein
MKRDGYFPQSWRNLTIELEIKDVSNQCILQYMKTQENSGTRCSFVNLEIERADQ